MEKPRTTPTGTGRRETWLERAGRGALALLLAALLVQAARQAVASALAKRNSVDAIRRADLFAALVLEDTYPVASEVHDLLVKTHPSDVAKIEEIKELVWAHLAIDRVLDAAAPVEG